MSFDLTLVVDVLQPDGTIATRTIDAAQALVNLSVASASVSTPPSNPNDGDVYIIGVGATDAWSGQDNKLAVWKGGWFVVTPADGWMVWVADDAQVLVFDGSSWVAGGIVGPPGIDGVDGTNGTNGMPGADGADGLGVPAGGLTGQVLRKLSDDDNDTEWSDTLPGHTHSESDVTGLVADLATLAAGVAASELAANKGVAGGYASLDGGTKVPIAQVPTGSSGTTVCIGNDSRLSDARTPTAHTHPQADVTGLVADLAAKEATANKGVASGYCGLDSGTKVAIAFLPTGATGTTICIGNDARLSDARTPLTHATSHKSGGTDVIKLDELGAPTDITTLNASASQHGLLPKLSGDTATFLRGDGTWVGPSPLVQRVLTADLTLATGQCLVVASYLRIPSGFNLTLQGDADLEIN